MKEFKQIVIYILIVCAFLAMFYGIVVGAMELFSKGESLWTQLMALSS